MERSNVTPHPGASLWEVSDIPVAVCYDGSPSIARMYWSRLESWLIDSDIGQDRDDQDI